MAQIDIEDMKTIFNVLIAANEDGYTNVNIVVGSDRQAEFENLVGPVVPLNRDIASIGGYREPGCRVDIADKAVIGGHSGRFEYIDGFGNITRDRGKGDIVRVGDAGCDEERDAGAHSPFRYDLVHEEDEVRADEKL
jgi:hypothetical protein